MKKKSYAALALSAMRRASKQAIENAAKLDLTIPVWKKDEIVFVKAKELLHTLHSS